MNTKNTTKYTLAGLGLTMGLAIAAADHRAGDQGHVRVTPDLE